MGINLTHYICEQSVFFTFPTPEKYEILRIMSESLCLHVSIDDAQAIAKAVDDREREKSTGIGRGLAVPHCRTPLIDEIHLSVAVIKEGLYWEALDNQPVNFVFLVVGSDKKPEEYLRVLSALSMIVRNEENRENLLNCTTAKEVLTLLNDLGQPYS